MFTMRLVRRRRSLALHLTTHTFLLEFELCATFATTLVFIDTHTYTAWRQSILYCQQKPTRTGGTERTNVAQMPKRANRGAHQSEKQPSSFAQFAALPAPARAPQIADRIMQIRGVGFVWCVERIWCAAHVLLCCASAAAGGVL